MKRMLLVVGGLGQGGVIAICAVLTAVGTVLLAGCVAILVRQCVGGHASHKEHTRAAVEAHERLTVHGDVSPGRLFARRRPTGP
jgi:hypothetical protein